MVGYWRRNCPNCSAQYEVERKARFAPTVLPCFRKCDREYGAWATKVLRLCEDAKTAQLTRTVALIRLKGYLGNGDDKPFANEWAERLAAWLLRTRPYREILGHGTLGSKLQPKELEQALIDFYAWFHSIDGAETSHACDAPLTLPNIN